MKFKMHAVIQFQETSGSKFMKGILCCVFFGNISRNNFLQIVDKIWGIIFKSKTDWRCV